MIAIKINWLFFINIIKTTFKLRCYTFEGVDAIKDSMHAAQIQCSDHKFAIKF